MPEQDKLPWYKRHEDLIVKIGLLAFILGIAGIIVNVIVVEPGFKIGANELGIQIKQGDIIPVKINVKDTHQYIRPYNQEIQLMVSQSPHNILIKFAPIDECEPPFYQIMIICTSSNTPKGDYPIKIYARCKKDPADQDYQDFNIKVI